MDKQTQSCVITRLVMEMLWEEKSQHYLPVCLIFDKNIKLVLSQHDISLYQKWKKSDFKASEAHWFPPNAWLFCLIQSVHVFSCCCELRQKNIFTCTSEIISGFCSDFKITCKYRGNMQNRTAEWDICDQLISIRLKAGSFFLKLKTSISCSQLSNYKSWNELLLQEKQWDIWQSPCLITNFSFSSRCKHRALCKQLLATFAIDYLPEISSILAKRANDTVSQVKPFRDELAFANHILSKVKFLVSYSGSNSFPRVWPPNTKAFLHWYFYSLWEGFPEKNSPTNEN